MNVLLFVISLALACESSALQPSSHSTLSSFWETNRNWIIVTVVLEIILIAVCIACIVTACRNAKNHKKTVSQISIR
jgi:heme/copper-type cytochrome/quinol oxidase subunit 2